MDNFVAFFNSNFFTALITLLVGGFAIVLYVKQKLDYKRDVALLIRQEIRYAEQQIGNARSYSENAENYLLEVKLLPTNSWYKNINLFINDFEQPQIDTISRFYAQLEYMDIVIRGISNYKTSRIEEIIIHRREAALPTSGADNSQSLSIDPPTKVSKLGANAILKDVSGGVEFISNTPIGEKFKEISKKKWYQIL